MFHFSFFKLEHLNTIINILSGLSSLYIKNVQSSCKGCKKKKWREPKWNVDSNGVNMEWLIVVDSECMQMSGNNKYDWKWDRKELQRVVQSREQTLQKIFFERRRKREKGNF